MRYEFYGRKNAHAGKTIWEIVGNLKNFGVGRLLRTCRALKYENPSFIRINKVQPLPPPKQQFQERAVMVWIDEYFNGKKVSENKRLQSFKPLYHLIPKREEEDLCRRLREYEASVEKRQIPKYFYWPPLYKKLWEARAAKDPNSPTLPKLSNICKLDSESIILLEEEKKPPECNLYKTSVSVEEKLKEIVHLQKIVNAKTVTEE